VGQDTVLSRIRSRGVSAGSESVVRARIHSAYELRTRGRNFRGMVSEADDRLQIRLLGAVEAITRTNGGRSQPVNVGGRTQRRVLAVLSAARPDVVSVDQLADATWGDDLPARAEHNIRTYVSRLRAALGSDVVLDQVGDGYRIDLVDAGFA
jgi:DNA-binding response OmpR family regulator